MDFEKNSFVFFTISSLLSCAKETRFESQRKINRKHAATERSIIPKASLRIGSKGDR
jgi:hypothetical protein